jgi:lipopolysaccharide transport system ATP-binding protein
VGFFPRPLLWGAKGYERQKVRHTFRLPIRHSNFSPSRAIVTDPTDPVIRLRGVSKSYAIYEHNFDRLREAITRKARHHTLHALQPLDLQVGRGEVVGVIGRNGAGKSTLLKLVATTLVPTTGRVLVNGRIAPILDLGAGFHPDMTGQENVYLSASIMGMTTQQIEASYDEIIDFAELREFMDQPVKTYSSGMFTRLAFAVATSVEPDILIIDEALSVGDGAFARKSFDRIMAFKEVGKTIFFCSHSLYQVEALCTRALWLDRGSIRGDGDPSQVVPAYRISYEGQAQVASSAPQSKNSDSSHPATVRPPEHKGTASIVSVSVYADGIAGQELTVRSRRTQVRVTVRFASDPQLPPPTVAVGFLREDRLGVASVLSANDRIETRRTSGGEGWVTVVFPEFPVLKGRYTIDVYLLCERGFHRYDSACSAAWLNVVQDDLEQGVVSIPRRWETSALPVNVAY